MLVCRVASGLLCLSVVLFLCSPASSAFSATAFAGSQGVPCDQLLKQTKACTPEEFKTAGRHNCISRRMFRKRLLDSYSKCVEQSNKNVVDFASKMMPNTQMNIEMPTSCRAGSARILSKEVPIQYQNWVDFTAVADYANALDPVANPVVQIEVKSILCATGCCDVEIFLRPGTTDVSVLKQLLLYNEYAFLYNLGWKPKSVLDAGANTGIAAIIFANLFPDATIVSVEPDSSNFATLQKNTAKYPNVHAENRGLWDKEAGLIINSYPGSWGTTVKEVAAGAPADLQATTVSALLKKHNLTAFEYAKIDIEGAEIQVLTPDPKNDREWIKGVRLISVETHDRFAPGSRQSVINALAASGRVGRHTTNGEYDIWEF